MLLKVIGMAGARMKGQLIVAFPHCSSPAVLAPWPGLLKTENRIAGPCCVSDLGKAHEVRHEGGGRRRSREKGPSTDFAPLTAWENQAIGCEYGREAGSAPRSTSRWMSF